jgi:hypothetical protein
MRLISPHRQTNSPDRRPFRAAAPHGGTAARRCLRSKASSIKMNRREQFVMDFESRDQSVLDIEHQHAFASDGQAALDRYIPFFACDDAFAADNEIYRSVR